MYICILFTRDVKIDERKKNEREERNKMRGEEKYIDTDLKKI